MSLILTKVLVVVTGAFLRYYTTYNIATHI